jgi:two-component system, NtrC family, sensor histidine kinase HydH
VLGFPSIAVYILSDTLLANTPSAMADGKKLRFNWLDIFWLAFLVGLAVLPPIREIHKQLTLAAIGIVQISEGWILERWPNFGRSLVVLLKILLATILINHTGDELSINSSYYPIYYVPVVTAAVYFDVWATLAWTLFASAAYCSYLYPALQEYRLTTESMGLLAIRILFFFLAAMIVNRFAVENRRQTQQYQILAEELAETNLQLRRAQAEARRSERLAALGQLSAGLAHEIRNPLGVIKGSAEMLNQKLHDSNPLASELAGYISSEVNRLSTLVTRFLNFARPLRAEVAPRNIADLLDHALNSVAEQWRGGPVKVEKHYERNLALAPLDEGLFEQAFVNLIHNAYEAMGENGGTLRLEISSNSQNQRPGIEVRVKDTGPGIPTDQREQIFNPFVTTKATGVGLGLSIVSKIVDEHHGTIRVESAPGEGACFIVFFPLAEQPESVGETSVAT